MFVGRKRGCGTCGKKSGEYRLLLCGYTLAVTRVKTADIRQRRPPSDQIIPSLIRQFQGARMWSKNGPITAQERRKGERRRNRSQCSVSLSPVLNAVSGME